VRPPRGRSSTCAARCPSATASGGVGTSIHGRLRQPWSRIPPKGERAPRVIRPNQAVLGGRRWFWGDTPALRLAGFCITRPFWRRPGGRGNAPLVGPLGLLSSGFKAMGGLGGPVDNSIAFIAQIKDLQSACWRDLSAPRMRVDAKPPGTARLIKSGQQGGFTLDPPEPAPLDDDPALRRSRVRRCPAEQVNSTRRLRVA
jgi:hypothetical protein